MPSHKQKLAYRKMVTITITITVCVCVMPQAISDSVSAVRSIQQFHLFSNQYTQKHTKTRTIIVHIYIFLGILCTEHAQNMIELWNLNRNSIDAYTHLKNSWEKKPQDCDRTGQKQRRRREKKIHNGKNEINGTNYMLNCCRNWIESNTIIFFNVDWLYMSLDKHESSELR